MQDSSRIAALDENNPDRGGISYFLLARVATKLRDAYVIVWEYFAQRFIGGTKNVWRVSMADLILLIMCFEQGRRWFNRRNYTWNQRDYRHTTPFQCHVGLPGYLRLPKPHSHALIWSGELIPRAGSGKHVTTYFDDANAARYLGWETIEVEVDLWQLIDSYPGEHPIRGGPIPPREINNWPPDIPINDPPEVDWDVPFIPP